MEMSITAMKQALEALEKTRDENAAYLNFKEPYHEAITALRTAIQQAEKQEPWLQAVADKIEAKLLSHRLSLHDEADRAGTGYPLVDALCCGQKDLEIGKQEIKSIVEVIYHVLAAAASPAQSAPVQNGKCFLCGERDESCTSVVCPKAAQPAPVQDIGVEQDERVFARIAARKNRDAAHMETAQREWLGLTDEEVMNCYLFWVVDLQDIIGFYKGIETKLREKNT
jgi:hypothetical protein